MPRRDWEFQFTAADVAEGAAKKATYHAQRRDHWAKEVDRVRKEIKESGIDIQSHDVTGGQRHEVRIDPAMARRLSEAESKYQSHDADHDTYLKWERVLRTDPTKHLKLNYDDVLYFDLA